MVNGFWKKNMVNRLFDMFVERFICLLLTIEGFCDAPRVTRCRGIGLKEEEECTYVNNVIGMHNHYTSSCKKTTNITATN
jgi:hypothetical protein